MNKKEKILAFTSLSIACFLTVLDGTIVNVSLPSMAKYFNTDLTGISWVTIGYLISFSALLINFSKIADIYGRKKLFIIGLVIFGTSSICCGLSTSIGAIVTFRIIQGIGAAILAPLAIPLAMELFGKESMGKLGIIIGMIISVSSASGPVVGGFLSETFGFKAIFYVNIPFIIIALILGIKYVRECYDNTISKKIDFVGSVLLVYGLGALIFLLVKGNDYGWSSKKIIFLIVTSLSAILIFVSYEKKIKNPMIEFSLFNVKSYTASIILNSVIFFAYMPFTYLINFYLENSLGYSVLKAGLMLGMVSVIAFFMSPVFGVISKRTSIKFTSFIAIICVTLGNLTFVFMNGTNDIKLIYSAIIFIGIGTSATASLYLSSFEEISLDKNGIASGILNSLRQLAACIAIALVATLSSHYEAIAVQNTKDRIVSKVNSNVVLEQKVKDSINEKIKAIKTDSSTSSKNNFSKEDVHTLVQNQENEVLKTIPIKMQATVIEKFNRQEKEIDAIVDEAKIIKDEESYKVYNKCFLITGLIAVLGLIAVPFNSKRKNDEITEKLRLEKVL